MNHNKFWLTIGIAFIVLMCGYLYMSRQYINVLNALKTIDKIWLLLGFVLIGLYWILETKIVHLLVSAFYRKRTFCESLKVSMIGQFFSGITPFATGGQPAQLVLLKKIDVPVGVGSSILMSKFVVYQAVLVIYAAVLLMFKSKLFLTQVDNIFDLVLIGFGVNLSVIILLIFLSMAKKTNTKISGRVIDFLYKVRLVNDKKRCKINVRKHIDEFHVQISYMKNQNRLLLKIVVLTTLQLTCYFIVPYCLYRGFGLSGVSIINIIAATAFVLMVTSFVPMPGGSGGAEGGFYLIFGTFFLPPLIVPAMLIWRVMTYYIWIMVGGMWVLALKTKLARS